MRLTSKLRLSINRLFLLTLMLSVALAGLLGFAASAKVDRASKAREVQDSASKPAIIKNSIAPQPLPDNTPLSPNASFTDNCGGGTCSIADGPNGAVLHRTIVASGLSGNITIVSVTFTGFTHTFLSDLSFLLVGPNGTANLEFWSDGGGGNPGVSNFTLTAGDAGATLWPTSSVIPTNNTTYKPADRLDAEPPTHFGFPVGYVINHAPGGNAPAGTSTFTSVFNGLTGAAMNGNWDLYVKDEGAGDIGGFTSWSVNITTSGGNQAPVITNLSGDSTGVIEGGAAVLLDTGTAASVTDSDSANFDTGNVTAAITTNKFSAEDVLGISTAGTVTLSNGTSVGSTVSVSGTAIGTIAAGGTGTGVNNLIVTLNANSTPTRVSTLLGALTYLNNNSVNPNINTRTISVTVDDGDGGSSTSNPAFITVSVTATGDELMTTFNGGASGAIPDNAPGIHLTLPVAGLQGNVTDVKVTITGLTHTSPNDLDFLLVAPDGTHNLEFWSDAAGGTGVVNLNVSLADFGATQLLELTAPATNSTVRAADYLNGEIDSYFGSATGAIHHPSGNNNGIFTFASSFAGAAPNGAWSLYVRDGQAADTGSFTSWSVAIATDGGPPINQAPVISGLNNDNPSFTEGGAALLLDVGGDASVADIDSTDFDTGNLTVSITANKFSAEDVLGISTAGTITLSNGTNVGSNVSVSGTAIGTIAASGTGTGGNDLIVTLNANATPTRVTTLLKALTYQNSNSINPNINARTCAVTVNDGDGATSGAALVTINVLATGDEPMTTFTNSTPVSVPDNSHTSSTIVVSGLSGTVLDVKVTITGLTHTFPDELDFLLVGPDGTHNLEFWSDVGGGNPGITSPVTISVADFGTSVLPDATPPTTGTYRAADYFNLETDANFGSTVVASGGVIHHTTTNGIFTFGSSFAGLTGAALNGTWTLYIADSAGTDTGGFTSWSLDIATPTIAFAEPSGACGAGNNPCFTTIQAAIDSVSTGGTVNVIGGTFNESPNLNKSATLNINGATTVNALTISNGTLNASNGGSFALTLKSGNLSVAGGAFNAGTGTVVFNGSAAQQAAGVTYNNLTINNTIGAHVTGVTLTGNATVNGVLTLTSSDLATGAFTLTQPNTTLSTGVSDVVGTVIRSGGPFAAAVPLTFGNPDNRITFSAAGTRPTSVTVTMAKAAPATYLAAVQRNYNISQVGGVGFSATLRLHYLDSELNGNSETPDVNFNFRKGPNWSAVVPTARNVVGTTDGWLENNAVTSFSQWTFAALAPTASGGSVTGRIVDGSGNPVEGAVVRLEGTQNRKFITDANGFYRFDNVETNGFYTVTPARANYSFTPSVRSFSQIGESTEAGFGATLSTSTLANPLDTPEYFVRQHYVDFLNREPDEAGFNFWSDQIIGCGTDQNCFERRRENVSAAFFLSIEFQRTGGLVDGLYRAANGARPDFAHFLPDTRTVGQGVRVGIDGWEAVLAANTEAFVNSFVNRPEFHAAYDSMDNSRYVDTMISHTGVAFTSAERDALVSGLGAGSMTRAEALRSIAENRGFVSAKFNETFVMMEYFGYLRRDPDASGFAFWLNKLSEFDGNFEHAEMVKAFIVSGEYRDRFPR